VDVFVVLPLSLKESISCHFTIAKQRSSKTKLVLVVCLILIALFSNVKPNFAMSFQPCNSGSLNLACFNCDSGCGTE